MNPQRTLAAAAAWLFAAAVLTGLLASAAATGLLHAESRAVLAAHLTGLMGVFLLVSVAWSLPHLAYGPLGQRRLAWTFIVGNWSNWALTLAKSFWGVRGIAPTGGRANDVFFALLTLFAVLPLLASAVGWAGGFTAPGKTGAPPG